MTTDNTTKWIFFGGVAVGTTFAGVTYYLASNRGLFSRAAKVERPEERLRGVK